MWPITLQQFSEVLGLKAPQQGDELLQGLTIDSRDLKENELFVAIKGELFDGHSFVAQSFENGAAAALVCKAWTGYSQLKPQHQAKCFQVDSVIQALRGLGAFFRNRLCCPVLAIGGSNGKTTVKQMVLALLGNGVTSTSKSQNGYLGIALTLCQRAHRFSNPPRFLVVEVGIDALGAMEEHMALVRPTHCALTALGPEHLEGLGSHKNAIKEELKMFRKSPVWRTAIWQMCDEHLDKNFKALANPWDKTVGKLNNHNYCYSFSSQGVSQTVNIGFNEQELSFEIPLAGEHNVSNFALAFALAKEASLLSVQKLKENWQGFKAPPLRMAVTKLDRGVQLINDCYNSSPESLKSALLTLQGLNKNNEPLYLVLGDMRELGEQSRKWHEAILPWLRNLSGATLCFYGQEMYNVYKALQGEAERGSLNFSALFHLSEEVAPQQFLAMAPVADNALVLVKGSRGLALERFAHALQQQIP